MTETASPADSTDSRRIEAFSDGVMAVIITIMALNVRAPDGPSMQALGHRLPALLIYVLSFTAIGMAWNHHHQLFRAVQTVSPAVMWANLHSLFWLSLVPIATEWVGSHYQASLPACAYGIVAAGSAAAYAVLIQTIIKAAGPGSALATSVGADRKGLTAICLYALGAALAWVEPWLGYTLYAGVAVMWFIPERRFT
ncbi:TMEM175 family protein [Streptacidiphilus anmyonensis]|uniref:TMEM175 family protein n=1 Tax=Streptacidiphilus anmyonensis TaxID=405782 RepID=UPI000AE1D6C6|nr:TMEM175 family protein [Streptacidiphilus anmyonensis]